MVKHFLVAFILVWGVISCGVKKPPTPLYSFPETALKNTPTPTPTGN